MTLLLTNDDGIHAPGLYALAGALAGFGPIAIVAPEAEQSGVGHAVSFRKAIHVSPLPERPAGVPRVAVQGTPADAVKFALRHHLREPPLLVVSGPNTGPNTGVNVLYSGTIGAAYEAVINGVSAVAVSSDVQEVYDWRACCHFARVVVERALAREAERRAHPEAFLRHGEVRPFLWNLNVPALPLEHIRGLRVTRHGASGFEEFFVPHENHDPETFRIRGTFASHDPSDLYDAAALLAGYASLTPLSLDLTDHPLVRELGKTWPD
ncbi:MAG: 5'/3'-nucleotidase SurE [Planctomycetota bacterium]